MKEVGGDIETGWPRKNASKFKSAFCNPVFSNRNKVKTFVEIGTLEIIRGTSVIIF